jgi:ribonuclease HII
LAEWKRKSSPIEIVPKKRVNWEDRESIALGWGGVDEVGRGALAGVVTAAAVMLPVAAIDSLTEMGVTDSKKLSPKRRQELATEISAVAIAVAIGSATVAEIERLNILQATFLAMKRAIAALNPPPTGCSIDGNRPIPGLHLPQTTLISGDSRSISIAAASIIAKVDRDRLMTELSREYPAYDWENNKGYGTLKHRTAIAKHGLTPHHRSSFISQQLTFGNLLDS